MRKGVYDVEKLYEMRLVYSRLLKYEAEKMC